MSCKITAVVSNSIADELGIKEDSEILTINGEKLRDYIDYKYMVMAENLEIEIKNPDGGIEFYEIEKNFEDDLGLVFESAIFDKIKSCANNCIFCFVDQQPDGLRKSLYVKDDDYRLSYLQGTYITLTNLTKNDKERIASLHLGPLYISVHTTNPELRADMLRNKNASKILQELNFFKEHEIPIHTQIVLCPGYNDGKELERTLNDLWKYKKILGSIAVVPVGLTKYRKEKLTSVSKKKALETIQIIENFNSSIKRNIASVSDEFFLIAEKELPPKKYYNGYSQLDDGVGTLRCIIDDFNKRAKKLPKIIKNKKKFTLACSISAENTLKMFAKKLNEIENVHIEVQAIKSEFWGDGINVAGLITAKDMINQLKNNCCKDVIVPSIMLRPYTTEFLDGLHIKDVEAAIKSKLHIIKDVYSTKELFDLILK